MGVSSGASAPVASRAAPSVVANLSAQTSASSSSMNMSVLQPLPLPLNASSGRGTSTTTEVDSGTDVDSELDNRSPKNVLAAAAGAGAVPVGAVPTGAVAGAAPAVPVPTGASIPAADAAGGGAGSTTEEEKDSNSPTEAAKKAPERPKRDASTTDYSSSSAASPKRPVAQDAESSPAKRARADASDNTAGAGDFANNEETLQALQAEEADSSSASFQTPTSSKEAGKVQTPEELVLSLGLRKNATMKQFIHKATDVNAELLKKVFHPHKDYMKKKNLEVYDGFYDKVPAVLYFTWVEEVKTGALPATPARCKCCFQVTNPVHLMKTCQLRFERQIFMISVKNTLQKLQRDCQKLLSEWERKVNDFVVDLDGATEEDKIQDLEQKMSDAETHVAMCKKVKERIVNRKNHCERVLSGYH
jgi:hypothetical protein